MPPSVSVDRYHFGTEAFSPKEAFLSAVIGKEVVYRVATILGQAGIRCMPLKGVVMQHTVYRDPSQRRITDVDILVDEGQYRRSMDILAENGFRLAPESHSHERIVYPPGLPLVVDLHASVFGPGRYRMATSAIFARATIDSRVFGARTWIPDSYDLYVHFVGHFAANRSDYREPQNLIDLRALAAHFNLDPARCAERLAECGLGRAARYTLVFSQDLGDTFATAVLAALPRDPAGDLAAALARRAIPALAPHSIWGALPGHFLNASTQEATRSIGLALGEKVRGAVRQLFDRLRGV